MYNTSLYTSSRSHVTLDARPYGGEMVYQHEIPFQRKQDIEMKCMYKLEKNKCENVKLVRLPICKGWVYGLYSLPYSINLEKLSRLPKGIFENT